MFLKNIDTIVLTLVIGVILIAHLYIAILDYKICSKLNEFKKQAQKANSAEELKTIEKNLIFYAARTCFHRKMFRSKAFYIFSYIRGKLKIIS